MRVVGGHSNSDDDEVNPTAGKLRRVVCMTGGEKEGSRIGIGVPECSSPARVALCRLLAIVRKCRGGKGVALEERESKHSRGRREKFDPTAEEVRRDSPERLPENRPIIGVSEIISQGIHHSGCQRQEMTFNLAAGLGLLSLIAASKTELDKTMELRREMEVFLRGIKEEHQSNGTTPKPSDGVSNARAYSFDDHAPSLNQPESGISLVCDKHCNMHQKEASVEGMNHLEEELAAELERLQVDVETGELSENHEEVNTEVPASTETTTRSISVSSGEVVDPQDQEEFCGGNTEYCGVPPLELERRLHEVLEARQEERIKELEVHLECMKRKLQEKEVEVTWWKDTAKLISKQVHDPSRLLR